MKNSKNIIVLITVMFIALIGIAVMLLAPSIVNNFSDVVGYAAHPIYPSFSSPESRLTINGNALSISDTTIYKTGYYSINGAAWVPFTLSGTILSGNWLSGNANANLPNFGQGESYVVIYSCNKTNGAWNCHDGTVGRWQLQIITSGVSANPSIVFISPTPNNAATITTSNTEIKANITGDSNAISSWIDFDKSVVGYWSMDSYTTTGINDNSTYKNFASFNGGVTASNMIAGVRGKALRLDGKESDYVDMGDKFDLGTQSWTYSFWFKDAKNDRMYILSKGASGGYDGMRIETYTDLKGAAIFGGASAYKVIYGPNILLNDGNWHHIAITFDRNGNAVWYTDGVAGTPADISSYSGENIDVPDDFVISGGWDTYVNGSIDELMIFNRALSVSEIKALYDSKINKFDATFSNLVNGQHIYTMYAVDGTGNLASSSRNFNVNAAITCTSQCNANQCSGSSAYKTCSDTNGDGCNELSATISCPQGYTCSGAGICSIAAMTCSDGIRNQGETGTDCGGPCPECSSSASRTFYISTSGNDGNSGTSASSTGAWKTLAHACASATQPGDLIHIVQGTYDEYSRCDLSVGVSIEGEGMRSIIRSHYATTRSSRGIGGGAISLISSNEGTNGNQTISNLRLDGGNLMGQSDGSVAYVGIYVFRRSNVKIHDCTIIDYFSDGAVFFGTTVYNEPTTYATGNEVYNCNLTDNGDTDGTWGAGGQIEIAGQEGIKIHDNIIDGTGRALGHNGNILSGAYYNKGLKFYKNKVYKPDYDGEAWNFHIELWDSAGGIEINNNEFYGSDNPIDIAGHFNIKGDYPYSWYIHDNYFEMNPVMTENGKAGITLEDDYIEDVWITRNHFKNIPRVIDVGNSHTFDVRRVSIYYNIFENCGWSEGENWQDIMTFRIPAGYTLRDVYVYNNIFLRNHATTHTTAIKLTPDGEVINLNVKNNIILDSDNGEFFYIDNSGSIDGLYVDNNILYGNANNNKPVFLGNDVSNYEFLRNVNADPMFVDATNGDFHLKFGSSAIDKGVNVGLTSDYDGNSVPYPAGGSPDIGAYEYR